MEELDVNWDMDVALDTLCCAKMFRVAELEASAQRVISERLTADNALQVLDRAFNIGDSLLAERALNVMDVGRVKEFMSSIEFPAETFLDSDEIRTGNNIDLAPRRSVTQEHDPQKPLIRPEVSKRRPVSILYSSSSIQDDGPAGFDDVTMQSRYDDQQRVDPAFQKIRVQQSAGFPAGVFLEDDGIPRSRYGPQKKGICLVASKFPIVGTTQEWKDAFKGEVPGAFAFGRMVAGGDGCRYFIFYMEENEATEALKKSSQGEVVVKGNIIKIVPVP